MTETGWIVPGAFIGNQISQFRWYSQMPEREGIKASRNAIRDGYIYTILEGYHQGDEITVDRGVIIIYEKAPKGD
jgi:hypothetical protein